RGRRPAPARWRARDGAWGEAFAAILPVECDFQRCGCAKPPRREPAVRTELAEAQRLEALAIELRGARAELVLVAFGLVFAGEGLQEGDPAAQLGHPGQALVQFAGGQVVQHG